MCFVWLQLAHAYEYDSPSCVKHHTIVEFLNGTIFPGFATSFRIPCPYTLTNSQFSQDVY